MEILVVGLVAAVLVLGWVVAVQRMRISALGQQAAWREATWEKRIKADVGYWQNRVKEITAYQELATRQLLDLASRPPTVIDHSSTVAAVAESVGKALAMPINNYGDPTRIQPEVLDIPRENNNGLDDVILPRHERDQEIEQLLVQARQDAGLPGEPPR